MHVSGVLSFNTRCSRIFTWESIAYTVVSQTRKYLLKTTVRQSASQNTLHPSVTFPTPTFTNFRSSLDVRSGASSQATALENIVARSIVTGTHLLFSAARGLLNSDSSTLPYKLFCINYFALLVFSEFATKVCTYVVASNTLMQKSVQRVRTRLRSDSHMRLERQCRTLFHSCSRTVQIVRHDIR